MEKLKAGVLGCTGIVGQHFVRMLSDHPYFELSLLAASKESAEKEYSEAVNWVIGGEIPEKAATMPVEDLSRIESSVAKIEVIFSALPSSIAGPVEEMLRAEGKFVFSNASSHRMAPDVPILLAEVNPEHLSLARIQREKYRGFIVTNSNCVVAGLALVLKPLMKFRPKNVVVTTYQSVSGAGLEGLYAMEIMDNLIPYIEKEEEKIIQETRKILGEIANGRISSANLELLPSCCRVPVREGHLESVVVEFEEEIDPQEIKKALQSFTGIPQKMELPSAPERPIVVLENEKRPQPRLDLKGGGKGLKEAMAVTVGRIRKQLNRIALFLLVHNTVRGAAGSSVLNAELALRLGYMD